MYIAWMFLLEEFWVEIAHLKKNSNKMIFQEYKILFSEAK